MPPLKDPAQRRNRHKPLLGELAPAPGHGWQHGPVPDPPEGMTEATVTAWHAWLSGWSASFLTPGDVPALRVLAQLHDAVDRGELVRATELRLWLDALGLSPKGALQLRRKPPEKPVIPAATPAPGARFGHLRPLGSEDGAA